MGALRERNHPAKFPTCERKRPKTLSAPSKEHTKIDTKRIQPSQVPSQAGSQTSHCHPSVLGFDLCKIYKLRDRVPYFVVKESFWVQNVAGESLRGHCVMLWDWNLDYVRDPKMLEMPARWNICQGKLNTGSSRSPGEECLFQKSKLEEWIHLSSLLSGILCLFCCVSVLLWYSIKLWFVQLNKLLYILCHCIFEVFNFFYILQGLRLEDCLRSHKRLEF